MEVPLEKFQDECAVFGIYGSPEASNQTYLGLYAQQHRGQESSGIVSSDGEDHYVLVGMGLVNKVFKKESIEKLRGSIAIGHNRYSTTGESLLKNAQPLAIEYSDGYLAIAHNGNIVNAASIRADLEKQGSIFRTTMDTEVVAHLVAKSTETSFMPKVIDALLEVKGAYSMLIMNDNEMIVVRDPYGFRPLAMGRLGDAYVFASETCAFDLIGATYERDVMPGELIHVTEEGYKSHFPFPKKEPRHCVFEFIYFARPDSYIFGESVHKVRKGFVRELAKEKPVKADIVIPVPDSGVPAAMGYAEESGIPFDIGMIRNHYVGRTFIEPESSIRHFGVKIKLNPIKAIIEGKRVVLVDDSIVRGTTSKKIISMVKAAGASEVHMRVSSPPTTHSCFYGIDTPTQGELAAANYSLAEIEKYLKADSLAYLNQDRMLAMFGGKGNSYCTACFDGNYPIQRYDTEILQPELFDRIGE